MCVCVCVCADAVTAQLVLGVEIPDDAARFQREFANEARVLLGLRLRAGVGTVV